MRHLKNFKIFEAKIVTVEDWAGAWQELPEWKLLQLMGFEIHDTNKNGTLTIHSPYSVVKPRLTSSGYVRTSKQGYVYQTYEKDPMPSMLGYVITRFAKKGISQISMDDLESFMKSNPDMVKYLMELPDIKSEILKRTGISDPLGDLYKKYGLTTSTVKWLNRSTSDGKWEINESTGKIDVRGSFVDRESTKLGIRGVKFGVIDGNFEVSGTGITSLDGSPDKIGGSLLLHTNPGLTSLKGMTQDIGMDFQCFHSGITSLEGAPREIRGNFYCNYGNLSSLEGAPLKVGGNFGCGYNPLTSLKGAPLEIGGKFIYGYELTINWGTKGWLTGVQKFPELFGPLIIDRIDTNEIDRKDYTPEILSKIRNVSPDTFEVLSRTLGMGASVVADLGDLGF